MKPIPNFSVYTFGADHIRFFTQYAALKQQLKAILDHVREDILNITMRMISRRLPAYGEQGQKPFCEECRMFCRRFCKTA